jgi:DNA-binding NarL/FixJ family response regulator
MIKPECSVERHLSEFDLRILGLTANGHASIEIARTLGVSERTLRRRYRAMLDATGASSVTQVVVLAVRRGLV